MLCRVGVRRWVVLLNRQIRQKLDGFGVSSLVAKGLRARFSRNAGLCVQMKSTLYIFTFYNLYLLYSLDLYFCIHPSTISTMINEKNIFLIEIHFIKVVCTHR